MWQNVAECSRILHVVKNVAMQKSLATFSTAFSTALLHFLLNFPLQFGPRKNNVAAGSFAQMDVIQSILNQPIGTLSKGGATGTPENRRARRSNPQQGQPRKVLPPSHRPLSHQTLRQKSAVLGSSNRKTKEAKKRHQAELED
jgi:hypothetical protein